MRYTIYLKGKYAPGGFDWIQGNNVIHTDSGIWIWPILYVSDPIFFPWSSVERVQ